jgi:curved DNA-binding protein CbpA
MNPYDELGVPPDADIDAINAAYRGKARRAHPDAGGSPEAFERLSRAVGILRDPERRARFDQTGETEQPQHNPKGAAIDALVQAFQQAIRDTRDPRFEDLVGKAKVYLQQAIENGRTERSSALRNQRTTADALDRLGHKGDGPDFLRKVLEDQAAAISRALVAMAEREAVLLAAIEMADGYEWRRDERPEQQAFAMFTATGSTNGTTTFR